MTTTRSFFISINPGLEELALQELQSKAQMFLNLSLSNTKLHTGGIEFEAPYPEALALNHVLKLPTRMLLRLDQFRCRDFPKLFNKIKKFDWSPYLALAEGQVLNVEASAHRSRLIHSKRLEQAVLEGLQAYFKAQPPKKKYVDWIKSQELPLPSIYVRLEDDDCHLSIDTSGERMGKRGYRGQVSEAPIRENLAAALFYAASQQLTSAVAQLTLVDPMCGSGTIPLEAVQFYVPQQARAFAYQGFPSLLTFKPQLLQPEQLPKLTAYGLDIEVKNIAASRSNAEQAQAQNLEFFVADLFAESPLKIQPDLVISNTPYGKRVSLSEAETPNEPIDFSQLLQRIAEQYSAQVIGLLVPKAAHISEYQNYRRLNPPLHFSNGGIPVSFWLFTRREKA